MEAGSELGFQYDVQEHTGYLGCFASTQSGDLDMYMKKLNFPSRNDYDCRAAHTGHVDEDCDVTYAGEGPDRLESVYILIHANEKIVKGELVCAFAWSRPYINRLIASGNQDELDRFQQQAESLNDDALGIIDLDDYVIVVDGLSKSHGGEVSEMFKDGLT